MLVRALNAGGGILLVELIIFKWISIALPSKFSQYRYRQPLSKYSLRYDKLLVDKDVYVFNELSGTVEQVGGGIQEEMDLTASSSPTTPYRSPFNRNVS
jgi:hypothetical protein